MAKAKEEDLNKAADAAADGERELSGKEKAGLFEIYDKLKADVTKATQELEASKKTCSDHVKKMAEAFGRPGPFKWKGKMLTISRRGENYHFKTRGDDEVEEIG